MWLRVGLGRLAGVSGSYKPFSTGTVDAFPKCAACVVSVESFSPWAFVGPQ
jgi:hypothetical protein